MYVCMFICTVYIIQYLEWPWPAGLRTFINIWTSHFLWMVNIVFLFNISFFVTIMFIHWVCLLKLKHQNHYVLLLRWCSTGLGALLYAILQYFGYHCRKTVATPFTKYGWKQTLKLRQRAVSSYCNFNISDPTCLHRKLNHVWMSKYLQTALYIVQMNLGECNFPGNRPARTSSVCAL